MKMPRSVPTSTKAPKRVVLMTGAADLADFDLRQAHGGRQAARRIVVQEDRHFVADFDVACLLVLME